MSLPHSPQRRVSFELAKDEDDSTLSALVEGIPGTGLIRTAMLYRPSFFTAVNFLGRNVQVIVARSGRELVGVATRSLRPTYINGERVIGGYLGDLRLVPQHRRGIILARGYQYLRRLDQDQRCAIYSTVINEDNVVALRTLLSGRAGLPTYVDVGRVNVFIIYPTADIPSGGEQIERGSHASLAGIVWRLNQNRLQFAQAYDEEDFLNGRFTDLRLRDFYLLRNANKVTGALAVWDQSSFRQLVVVSYPPMLEAFRVAAEAANIATLPAPNVSLNLAHLAFISTESTADFRVLLRQVCNDLSGRGLRGVVVSLHERDPRSEVMAEFQHSRAALRLFAVTFGSAPELDNRIPYFETAFI